MPHGLSDEFFAALTHGDLAWLVERVRRDHTLDLEIRDDEIQVYYRGGRLMYVQRRAGSYPSMFDENYFANAHQLPCSIPDDARRADAWLSAIPLLKQEMDFHMAAKERNEREFQQILVRENNFATGARGTDYYICSMEYQTKLGRYDVVAVHWPSEGHCRKQTERLPLALIEIKFGDHALNGECGLGDHLKDFAALAQDPTRAASFCAEMTMVFRQKHELGLVPGTDYHAASISSTQLQVIFVLANTNPMSKRLAPALDCLTPELLRLFPGGVWISRASQFSAGLFHDQMMTIDDFHASLKAQRSRNAQWTHQFRNRL